MKRAWLVCADCELPYSDEGWADFVVSDAVWAQLTEGDGAEVLCMNCMTRRARRLGVEAQARIASGPFADKEWLLRGPSLNERRLDSPLPEPAAERPATVPHPETLLDWIDEMPATLWEPMDVSAQRQWFDVRIQLTRIVRAHEKLKKWCADMHMEYPQGSAPHAFVDHVLALLDAWQEDTP